MRRNQRTPNIFHDGPDKEPIFKARYVDYPIRRDDVTSAVQTPR